MWISVLSELKKDKKTAFLFAAAVLIRIAAMGLFSSDYQREMFEPFISCWLDGIKNGFFNPYQYCYDNGIDINFPYPCVMLAVMTPGGILSEAFRAAPLFVRSVLFKLPLLVFDIIGFAYLLKMFKGKARTCCLVYMYSPITLYAVYMHGQLDIIPMILLFVSLYYLSSKKEFRYFVLSSVIAACAALAKLHIIAVIPLIILYVLKRFGKNKAVVYTLSFTAVLLAGLSLFFGDGFIEGVILTSEQQTLFALSFPYGRLDLYISLFAAVIIYMHILSMNAINRDLLYGLCGMIFAIFLTLCVPMPGWYMWIVPFIAVFMVSVNCRRDGMACSIALNLCYLIYFTFFHFKQGICDLYFLNKDLSFLKIDVPILKNISFTLLTGTLVYFIFIIYKFGITECGYYNFHSKAFVIGISGDSGTGKSTLQSLIGEMFPPSGLIRIEGDGDHKWERESDKWQEYTHLDPRANYLYRQAMDIKKLKNGQNVRRVNYDHATGKFTEYETVSPKRYISISGLHTLYLPQLRDDLDLSIFMEAEDELRCRWKLERDVGCRGRSREDVLRQIEERRADSEKYIAPQREFADIIFSYFTDDSEDAEQFGLRAFVSTKIDIETIVTSLRALGLTVSYEFSDNFRYQIAEYRPSLNGNTTAIDFDGLASDIIEYRYDITGEPCGANSIISGIEKLIILKAIDSELIGDE